MLNMYYAYIQIYLYDPRLATNDIRYGVGHSDITPSLPDFFVNQFILKGPKFYILSSLYQIIKQKEP